MVTFQYSIPMNKRDDCRTASLMELSSPPSPPYVIRRNTPDHKNIRSFQCPVLAPETSSPPALQLINNSWAGTESYLNSAATFLTCNKCLWTSFSNFHLHCLFYQVKKSHCTHILSYFLPPEPVHPWKQPWWGKGLDATCCLKSSHQALRQGRALDGVADQKRRCKKRILPTVSCHERKWMKNT